MNFLDKIFGRTELKNRVESLRQELKRCYEIRDEEKEAFNNQCIKFENKYKEAVLRIQQLEKDLNKSGISPIEPPAKPEPPKPAIGIMPEETKDVFGWVLLTDEYKEILKLLNKKEYGQKCMICKGETTLNDISLLNGRRVHKSCYDEYLSKVCSIKETDAKDYFQKNAVAVCMLKIIHSFWPTYPPDWQQRRKIVLERANNACENEECGESEDELHIHHIKELGAGGNHNLSNLKCLCVDCHNIITPGNKLGDNTIHNNSWLKRKKAIEEAIEKKKNISFKYINRNKVRSIRTIIPTDFMTLGDEGQHLGVVGYCFLRKQIRTFYIKRMSNVEILPGKSVKDGSNHYIIQEAANN